jgi:FlaA1/EpsC-like NDP-sugar epimerase
LAQPGLPAARLKTEKSCLVDGIFALLNSGVKGRVNIRRRLATPRTWRSVAWILVDAVVVVAAFYLATYLRFVDAVGNSSDVWQRLPFLLIPITAVFIAGNQAWSLNRRAWRYASGVEILMVFTSVGLSTMLLLAVDMVAVFNHARLLPIGVLVMGGFFTATGMTLVRYRWRIISALLRRRRASGATRALIYGAGDSGQFVVDRMMARPEDHEFALLGFVDDDRSKHGLRIHGLQVLGSGKDLDALIDKHRIDVIVLAISNATAEQRQRILNICSATPAQVKVAPNFFDIVASPAVPLVRELRVTDLLGRSEAIVDRPSCARVLEGKSVLVTGAAGSVGSELCRQIAAFGPRQLVGLDNNESGLYDLAIELRSGVTPIQLDMVVADVRNPNAISRAFEKARPDVVFHAAAYKHVPLMEEFPEEAVAVNVRGTDVVLEAARKVGAERFVFVSTDKAVKPVSLMGATKKVAEMLVMSNGHGPMLATAVRFGNVFGSRGSVVPTFARQIQRGGPVTVTHPEMTRFFMEISEAAILIIQAAAMTRGNDLFMLEMGEPVKIDDLARRMIRMRGLRPDTDIEIVYTGVRPGEKLHEDLVLDGEERFETEHPMIRRVQTRRRLRRRSDLTKLYALADSDSNGELAAQLMRLCDESEPEMTVELHDAAFSN